MSYRVVINTTCRACAMALAGHAPALKIQGAFVAEVDPDGATGMHIHANSPWVQAHDGSPMACKEHGRVMNLAAAPNERPAAECVPWLDGGAVELRRAGRPSYGLLTSKNHKLDKDLARKGWVKLEEEDGALIAEPSTSAYRRDNKAPCLYDDRGLVCECWRRKV